MSFQFTRLARWAAGICLAATALSISAPPAQASAYRNHAGRHHAHALSYAERRHAQFAQRAAPGDSNFSAIVVDETTGREIYGVNENGLRHPASITKVMTLYLLFEQLEKGTLTLQSRIPVSEHAAAQEPSKLGVPAGGDISVEDAIKAVVTRSANDMAVAIAEAVGHDEDTFAAMMTRKAHSLGMSRTIYRNASGLPNDEQITCARDLTVLGRALQERFPKYFRYFSTHEFVYDGEVIGNHNHLLGRVDGVDGIKTGYTKASGFNLLTSVHRDGRSLLAVVMGGHTAAARDHIMENLIEDHLAEASVGGRGAMVAQNDDSDEAPAPAAAAPVAAAPVREPPAKAEVVAEAAPQPRAHHAAEPMGQGDDSNEEVDDPAPRAVKPAPRPVVAKSAAPVHAERVASASPAALGWVKGPDGAPVPPTTKPKPAQIAAARTRDDDDDDNDDKTKVARSVKAEGEEKGHAKGTWAIQIGAADDADKADALLSRARARSAGLLTSAKPMTQKFKKGEDVYYRARFAGLDETGAAQACKALKRSGFSCFTAHD